MVASFMPGISDGFGFTTLAGSSLIELKKPTFYGGSNTPPPSQPVRQVKWISSKRAFSDTLRFCHAIIGAFMGYTAFRFFLQIMRGLRRNVILHVCLLAGSILLFIPNLEFAEEPSNDKCSEDSYFDFSGLVLIYT
ncbi:hypothetical protein BC829DRAFT_280603 [Chytridium lagenaria]|nr:hypothetical protein BC829DRAFT_280603 [Chytridium lagenaria]